MEKKKKRGLLGNFKDRPRIKVPLEPFDIAVEMLGGLSAALLVAIPIIYYGQLPDVIPSHFNAAGEVDGYSSKSGILLVPLIGFACAVGMIALSRFPHVFNYATTITEENALSQYRLGARMIRVMGTVVGGLFAYISWRIAEVALGNFPNLGSGFLIIFFVMITAPMLIYLFASLSRR